MTPLAALGRNLVAGARLALALPVRRLSFRVDVAQLLLVFAFSALIDVGGDWLRYGPSAQFSYLGAGNEFYTLGLLVAIAALVAIVARRPAVALAIPVIALAGAPVVQLGDVAMTLLLRGADVPEFAVSWLAYAIPVWFVAMIIRATWIAFEGEGRAHPFGVLLAGIVVAAPAWLTVSIYPSLPWWEADASIKAGTAASPGSELVQAAQAHLLDDMLGALDDERPGVTDLYFVAFDADGRAPALHEDVLRAQHVMDERWDTRGRSIVLANDPQTLLETPFATVTHLREALREIGGAIDAESDVVMVYIAGRPGSDGVDVSHPPLELLPLSPSTLRALLDDAGIKWRIVVVSACDSAEFAKTLADESTVVLAAGDGACTIGNDGSALGNELFGHALAERDGFADALDATVRAIEGKGAKPTLQVGSAIADVLKSLDRGNAARRRGRTI